MAVVSAVSSKATVSALKNLSLVPPGVLVQLAVVLISQMPLVVPCQTRFVGVSPLTIMVTVGELTVKLAAGVPRTLLVAEVAKARLAAVPMMVPAPLMRV